MTTDDVEARLRAALAARAGRVTADDLRGRTTHADGETAPAVRPRAPRAPGRRRGGAGGGRAAARPRHPARAAAARGAVADTVPDRHGGPRRGLRSTAGDTVPGPGDRARPLVRPAVAMELTAGAGAGPTADPGACSIEPARAGA
ncbi:hypothetical protein JCM9534A_09970 [Catenuloplanes indicus JCM 9534]